eukprot:Selendium_serpulae@DN3105_c1_g1_i1.p1
MGVNDFPFIRVTVLGASHSGKTSLINSLLNKNILPACFETDAAQTYYKLLRLPPDGDKKGALRSVMLELEDSWGSQRTDNRRIEWLFDMRRKQVAVPSGKKDFTPFNIWKPPRSKKNRAQCLTQGRMGYLICFDAFNMKSWLEAIRVHTRLVERLEMQKSQTPVIFLVATKTDKLPENDEEATIIPMAEQYVAKEFMRLWKTSALDGKNILNMFRDMTYLVLGNGQLWEIEYDASSEEEEPEEGCKVG